jgi:hypothetical protein
MWFVKEHNALQPLKLFGQCGHDVSFILLDTDMIVNQCMYGNRIDVRENFVADCAVLWHLQQIISYTV